MVVAAAEREGRGFAVMVFVRDGTHWFCGEQDEEDEDHTHTVERAHVEYKVIRFAMNYCFNF